MTAPTAPITDAITDAIAALIAAAQEELAKQKAVIEAAIAKREAG